MLINSAVTRKPGLLSVVTPWYASIGSMRALHAP